MNLTPFLKNEPDPFFGATPFLGRVEPRVVKRRPKPFHLMTQPRAVLREAIRLNGHPKRLK